MEHKERVFLVYQSPYSGGFELKDTFAIPRPCAKTSLNMTAVEYYYGQRMYTFDLSDEGAAQNAFRKIVEAPKFLHQNGT